MMQRIEASATKRKGKSSNWEILFKQESLRMVLCKNVSAMRRGN